MPSVRSLPRVKSLGSVGGASLGSFAQKARASSPAGTSASSLSPQKGRTPASPAGSFAGASRGNLLQKGGRCSTPVGGSRSPAGIRDTPSPTVPPDLIGLAGCDAGSPASVSSSSALDRHRSLPRAFERAKQAEESLQRKKDLQVAADWNECFKSAANRRDPEKLAHFWTELKGRLIKKFGTLATAFGSLKVGSDESLSFLNFSDMLRLIYLPLDQRISRLLFEIASGGDSKLLFHDLKLALMERNVLHLRNGLVLHHEKKERIHFYVQSFLSRLMQADDTVCAHSVDRFQRKLTVPLCKQIWKALMDRLGASGTRDVSVSRSVFERMLRDDFAGKVLQIYEVTYMTRIFDRVDTNAGYKPATGSVQLLALLGALLLLSPEPDRCLKVTLLFEAYDADEDGCLLYGQILALFQCISAQRPLADENMRGAKDFTFQEELAAQEGMRYYERTRWCLQRECRVEGDVVALREFWDALQRQTQMLEEILPSMVKMRWLMHPSQQEQAAAKFGEDDAAADRARRLSTGSVDPITGLAKRRISGLKGAPKPFLAATNSNAPTMSGRHRTCLAQAIQVGLAERDEKRGLEPVPSLVPFDSPPGATVSFSQTAVEEPPMVPTDSSPMFRPSPNFKETPPSLLARSSFSCGKGPRGRRVHIMTQPSVEPEPWSMYGREEFLAQNFKQSLRTLSEQRLNDLNESFNQRVDFNPEPLEPVNVSRARTPQAAAARTRPAVPAAADPARPASAAAPASGPEGKKGVPWSGSSPAADLLSHGPSAATRGVAMPNIDPERWGAASSERFRLFSAVKSSFGRAQLERERQAAPDPETGIGFQCFLCHGIHTLNAGCCT